MEVVEVVIIMTMNVNTTLMKKKGRERKDYQKE